MKLTVYKIICIVFFLTVLGCNSQFVSDEEILQQENIEALTKSVPVVCVDLYVTWDGRELYLGTACSGGGASGGGGSGSITSGYDPDDIIESPPYTPSEMPSGGSSHYNPSTGKHEYVYDNLTYIYDMGSTLDLVQKKKLDILIGYFLSSSEKNEELFHYMITKNVKIKFRYDPNSEYPAYYEPATKSIVIQDLDDLRTYQLQEEIVHSVQHQCFYGDQMLLGSKIAKNCEFEAKVYFDLFSAMNGFEDSFIATDTDSRTEFKSEYIKWILNIANVQNGRFTDIIGFNDLCERWIGYKGTFLPSFQPSLLLQIYRKPVPPQPPL